MIKTETRVRGIAAVRAETGGGVQAAIDLVNRQFAEFREKNDQRLAELEKGRDDVVARDQVEKISAAIGDATKAIEEIRSDMTAIKVGGAGDGKVSPEARAYAEGFNRYFRKGVEAGLQDLAIKASLTSEVDPDGGYTVPETMDSAIDRVLGTVTAMRGMANVMRMSAPSYKKLVNLTGTGSGWVSEAAPRPETGTPTLSEITITAMELYANPAATQRLLDDSTLNIETWLAGEVATEFGEAEGEAFIRGSGVNQPRGILSYDTVANASYSWGKVGFAVTGAAAGFATSDPTDALMQLYYALRQQYRGMASFLTSDAVLGTVRQFKDGQGNYIWAPPTVDGPATILGKPVMTDDNMDALGANKFPFAFGDFRRAYTITDVGGVRVLRDPFTNKPYVHFYTTKRVGGGITNYEAIKLLRCSA